MGCFERLSKQWKTDRGGGGGSSEEGQWQSGWQARVFSGTRRPGTELWLQELQRAGGQDSQKGALVHLQVEGAVKDPLERESHARKSRTIWISSYM